jgi:flagellar basal-body rod protein FlgF
MQNQLYVSLSAQVALERRLTTVATNVANLGTVGYRAEEVSFSSLVSKTGGESVAFASSGTSYINRASGPVTRTDNPLDVAVSGNAWLGIQTPAGTVYTRDGRLKMQASGALQTLNGYSVLDAGGSPLLLDPDGGPPTIAQDGMITQNGRQLGALGLFSLDPSATLGRFENSGVTTDKPATPVLDFGTNGVAQGFVEGSNVNPVMEMAKLMSLTRNFENVTNATSSSESSLKDAIKTLGSNSSS